MPKSESTESRTGESVARAAIGLLGLVLLSAGTWVTVSSKSGSGAATLITVGAVFLAGALAWESIESMSGPIGFTKAGKRADSLAQAGRTEEAEEVLDELVGRVMPKTQAVVSSVRTFRDRAFYLPGQKDLGLEVLAGTREPSSGADQQYTLPSGKRIDVEFLAVVDPVSGRRAAQRAIERLLV